MALKEVITDKIERLLSKEFYCSIKELRGMERGRQEGRSLILISQVQKKLDKGKSISQIAEELEEEVPVIERIYKAVAEEPEADLEIIFEKLKGDCKS